jgi:hypothetical protein
MGVYCFQSTEEKDMRYLALLAAGVILVGAGGNAGALPAAKSKFDTASPILLVQDKQGDTLKKRVKRAWRELTGYKFDVACPGFWLPVSEGTCTETGKNRDDARAKCESRNAFCQVRDAAGSSRRAANR